MGVRIYQTGVKVLASGNYHVSLLAIQLVGTVKSAFGNKKFVLYGSRHSVQYFDETRIVAALSAKIIES